MVETGSGKERKRKEAERIAGALRRTALLIINPNKTVGDDMFMNASFLVDKGQGERV